MMELASLAQPIPFSYARGGPIEQVFAGSTDCHMHFFDELAPKRPGATVTHPDATPEQYLAYRRIIGTSRCVVVQPSVYGYDNRPTISGLARLGDSARGVAVVPPEITDAALQDLHVAGIRGVRFNLVQPGGLTLADARTMGPRLLGIGWHIQIQLPPDGMTPVLEHLAAIHGRLVFDHMGRVGDADGAEMKTLLRLIDNGRTWVKLSAPYLDSRTPSPRYADRALVAQRLAEAAPDRMLWASDWPHATETTKPDDAALFDILSDWVPGEAARRKVLVDNPAALYGFL